MPTICILCIGLSEPPGVDTSGTHHSAMHGGPLTQAQAVEESLGWGWRVSGLKKQGDVIPTSYGVTTPPPPPCYPNLKKCVGFFFKIL